MRLAGERGLEVGVVADADQDGEEEDEGEVGEQKEKVGDKEHVQHVLLDPNHDSEKGEIWGKYSERCSSWQTGWLLAEDSAPYQWPRQRLGLDCTH